MCLCLTSYRLLETWDNLYHAISFIVGFFFLNSGKIIESPGETLKIPMTRTHSRSIWILGVEQDTLIASGLYTGWTLCLKSHSHSPPSSSSLFLRCHFSKEGLLPSLVLGAPFFHTLLPLLTAHVRQPWYTIHFSIMVLFIVCLPKCKKQLSCILFTNVASVLGIGARHVCYSIYFIYYPLSLLWIDEWMDSIGHFSFSAKRFL